MITSERLKQNKTDGILAELAIGLKILRKKEAAILSQKTMTRGDEITLDDLRRRIKQLQKMDR